MKAFWWFKENSVAGMARPGFNTRHWFSIPFDQVVILGWIGQKVSGTYSLSDFRIYLKTYVPQIFKFHDLNEESGAKVLSVFDTNEGIYKTLAALNEAKGLFSRFEISGDNLDFTLSEERVISEINFLKSQNIKTVVSLTEKQHSKSILQEHFDSHHLAIADLNPPTISQATQLADIIRSSDGGVAVHCMAGIGRTSTMIIAAHILLGENFEELQLRLKKQNPFFALTGSQWDFVKSVQASRI